MITKEQAQNLEQGQYIYVITETMADGSPRRFRVNGKCMTWKSPERQDEFRVPIIFGLKGYGYLNENNCHVFSTDKQMAVEQMKLLKKANDTYNRQKDAISELTHTVARVRIVLTRLAHSAYLNTQDLIYQERLPEAEAAISGGTI